MSEPLAVGPAPSGVQVHRKGAAEEIPVWAWREKCAYDPETGVVVSRKTGKEYGHVNKDGYRLASMRFQSVLYHVRIHRLAWALHHGVWPAGELDHINGNRADNRISNLRTSTRVLQALNSKNRKRRDLPEGVVFRPDSWAKPFVARINIDGKLIELGRFSAISDAAEAYREAREAKLSAAGGHHG